MPAALAQLAHVELAPRLQPDDEEEEHHQAVVDPVAQVLGEHVAADADSQLGAPQAAVGVRVDVRPGQRRRSPRPAAPSRRRSRCAGSRAPGRRGGAPTPSGPRTARSSARNCELPCAAELDDVAVGEARDAHGDHAAARAAQDDAGADVRAVRCRARCWSPQRMQSRIAVVISLPNTSASRPASAFPSRCSGSGHPVGPKRSAWIAPGACPSCHEYVGGALDEAGRRRRRRRAARAAAVGPTCSSIAASIRRSKPVQPAGVSRVSVYVHARPCAAASSSSRKSRSSQRRAETSRRASTLAPCGGLVAQHRHQRHEARAAGRPAAAARRRRRAR